MNVLALKWVSIILISSQMIFFDGDTLYSFYVSFADQTGDNEATDTFAQTKPPIERMTVELMENGKSLGAHEITLHTAEEIDSVTVEIVEYIPSYPVHALQNDASGQAGVQTFLARISNDEQEEWSIVGEGFSYTRPNPVFELNIQDVFYETDLEV